tara:strand:+ start:4623 stop:5015 length:393 start_codon:yes stop_codon:yes gene_type:complete
MKVYIILLSVFIFFLFIYDILSKTTEGMENNCDDKGNIQTLVYKNSGTIKNIEDSIKNIMEKINTLTTNDSKQNVLIQNIRENQEKYDKLAENANKLANSNRDKIKQAVDSAKQKGANSKKAQEKLQPIN